MIHSGPNFARLGALKRLAVGGADFVENDTAKGRRHRGLFPSADGWVQNRLLAAVPAASTSGAGQTT